MPAGGCGGFSPIPRTGAITPCHVRHVVCACIRCGGLHLLLASPPCQASPSCHRLRLAGVAASAPPYALAWLPVAVVTAPVPLSPRPPPRCGGLLLALVLSQPLEGEARPHHVLPHVCELPWPLSSRCLPCALVLGHSAPAGAPFPGASGVALCDPRRVSTSHPIVFCQLSMSHAPSCSFAFLPARVNAWPRVHGARAWGRGLPRLCAPRSGQALDRRPANPSCRVFIHVAPACRGLLLHVV